MLPFHVSARGTPPDPKSGRSGTEFASGEISTTGSYKYGKYEARIKMAGHSGVISTFFLWKTGSEKPDTAWNELDFEKAGINGSGSGKLQLNMIGGMPGPEYNEHHAEPLFNICDDFHIYGFEWTPNEVKYTLDGKELKKFTGSALEQFNQDIGDGMELHFNLWPGDKRFGGEFDPSILPLYQLIDWVRFSSYSEEGFKQEWQEDFEGGSIPEGWVKGTWDAPLGHATHREQNVLFKKSYAILALTSKSFIPDIESIPLPDDTTPPPGQGGDGGEPGGPSEPAPTPSTIASAELSDVRPNIYGKFEARMKYAAGDGIESAFVLWKQDSEKPEVFHNELAFKKLAADKMQVGMLEGKDTPNRHEKVVDTSSLDICNQFHTYGVEWTPHEVKYTIDGVEVHKITGSPVEQFNANVGDGLGMYFHMWPGDEASVGKFDSSKLPVFTYVDWVRFSSMQPSGWRQEWHEDFHNTPDYVSKFRLKFWLRGNWEGPLSKNREENVVFTNSYAILAVTPTSHIPDIDSIPLPTPEAPTPSTIASAELSDVRPNIYGKFEARMKHAAGDGIESAFVLWKKDSEKPEVFHNELAFKKLTANKMQVGMVEGKDTPNRHEMVVDTSSLAICNQFHTYGIEWTPHEVKYTIDGVEVHKITGSPVEQFNANVGAGLGMYFHMWPGEVKDFDPISLPAYTHIEWVRFSSMQPSGWRQEWQEDFRNPPEVWLKANWEGPHSKNRPENVLFANNYATLALTRTHHVPTADSVPTP